MPPVSDHRQPPDIRREREWRLAGCVDLVEAHAAERASSDDRRTAADVAHFLTPAQPVRETLDLFAGARAEFLPVVDNARDRRILGYLTEAYALRRYNRELEARRREELGDETLFTATRGPAD